MDKNTSIVPLNVTQLESIKVNRSRKATVEDKKRATEVLRRIIGQRRELLDQKVAELRAKLLAKAREESGWPRMRQAIDKVNAKINALTKQRDDLAERYTNETGFDTDGDLVGVGRYGSYQDVQDSDPRAVGKRRAIKISKSIDLQARIIENIATKFDKVEVRLILADNYGELMDIMAAVIGNGDDILSAEDAGIITTTD